MLKDPRTAFVSYTRQNGAAAAERVRDLLAMNGIKPWQDRTHLRGGEDFWQQIEKAIRRCSYLVMVLTPDAFGEERHVLLPQPPCGEDSRQHRIRSHEVEIMQRGAEFRPNPSDDGNRRQIDGEKCPCHPPGHLRRQTKR